MNSSWYSGEENALLLLHRLAQSVAGGGGDSDGSRPTFCAQDASIRDGARRLCEYAKGRYEVAKRIFGKDMEERGLTAANAALGQDGTMGKFGENNLQRRSWLARERDTKRM